MKRGAHAFLAAGLLLSISSAACSRSAAISGTIFVTTKSGDVKRGADVEVVLIARSEKLDTEVARVVKEGEERQAKVREEYLASLQQLVNRGTITSEMYRDYSDNLLPSLPTLRQIQAVTGNLLRQVVADGKVASARTDVNGVYVFKDVARGRYFLYTEHKLFDKEISWLVPIEMKGDDQKMDLSNSNSGWLTER